MIVNTNQTYYGGAAPIQGFLFYLKMKEFIVGCLAILIVLQIFAAQSENVDFATYEEVKDIPNHPEKYLIEVRSKELVEKDGSIPGSVNIPCEFPN